MTHVNPLADTIAAESTRLLDLFAEEIVAAIPSMRAGDPDHAGGRYFVSAVRDEVRTFYAGPLGDRFAIELEACEELGHGRTAELGWTTIPHSVDDERARLAMRSFIEETER